MDGVLVDGEPLHFEGVNRLLAEEGRALTLDEYRPYIGTGSGWREFCADLGLRQHHDHYRERYLPMLVELYRDRSVALPGAVDLVQSLRGRARLAICSSSILPWVEAALARIRLLEAFDEIVTGSDVRVAKPAPDIYEVASRRVGVTPERCLAIEDSPAGILSATAAGMTVWAVRSEYTRDIELPSCERVVDSLEALSAADIVGVAA